MLGSGGEARSLPVARFHLSRPRTRQGVCKIIHCFANNCHTKSKGRGNREIIKTPKSLEVGMCLSTSNHTHTPSKCNYGVHLRKHAALQSHQQKLNLDNLTSLNVSRDQLEKLSERNPKGLAVLADTRAL